MTSYWSCFDQSTLVNLEKRKFLPSRMNEPASECCRDWFHEACTRVNRWRAWWCSSSTSKMAQTNRACQVRIRPLGQATSAGPLSLTKLDRPALVATPLSQARATEPPASSCCRKSNAIVRYLTICPLCPIGSSRFDLQLLEALKRLQKTLHFCHPLRLQPKAH